MNILFVIDSLYTSNNGTSISAQRFIGALRQRGHQVRALCGDTPKTRQDLQLTCGDYCTGIFHFPIFQFLCEKHDFFYANVDRSIIREACDWADIVHVYTPFFLSNAVISYCQQTHKPVTAAFHVQPENITSSFGLGKVKPINTLIYRIFRRVTYGRVRHIHTPSSFIARELQKNGYKAQMHIISNGIHDDFLQAYTQRRHASEQFRIMMIGRLSREKRQDVIIRAMQYSRYADRIQLVFAGKGPEYKRYRRMGSALKNKPLFVYLNRWQLIEQLQKTDLYIHASDMEIEAISCIEAFATGLVPVIANSANSATPQFALDERSLFRAGDPKDLARAIDYWLDHPNERKRMEKQYSSAAHQYSLDHSAMLFEQMLLDEIADNQRIGNENPASVSIPATWLSALKRRAIRLYHRIA